MTIKDDGGPAYPQNDLSAYGMGPSECSSGMTLRDYFASQALTGLIGISTGTEQDNPAEVVAITAYRIADAMIKARGNHDH